MRKAQRPHIFIAIVLAVIICIGAGLRLYKLTYYPVGLYWDEASIAYNAYSILQTGKDEFGVSWPFLFEAFGEYKLPVYIYLTAFAHSFVSDIDLAVRLPSAIAGILSIPLMCLLTYQLFKQKNISFLQTSALSLISGVFFAVSPWSLQFSRAGFEANVAVFFILALTVCFLIGINSKTNWFIPAGIFALLAMFSYNSARLFVPLFVLGLFFLYKKQLLSRRQNVIIAVLISLFLFLPTLPYQIGKEGMYRATTTTYLGKLSFNKSLEKFLSQYADNFDPTYLFFHGDQNGRHSTRKLGMLHFFELPFILWGGYVLIRQKGISKRLIVTWLTLAPLPSALTEPSPHALRSLHILPIWVIFSALGLWHLWEFIKSRKKTVITAIFLVLMLVTIVYHVFLFTSEYFVRYAKVTALDWADGIKEAVSIIKYQGDQFDHIYISDTIPLVYLALYLPIEPSVYHQLPDRDIKHGISIDTITYFSESWRITPDPGKKILIISPWWQNPPEGTSAQVIRIKNGDPIFNVWEQDDTR